MFSVGTTISNRLHHKIYGIPCKGVTVRSHGLIHYTKINKTIDLFIVYNIMRNKTNKPWKFLQSEVNVLRMKNAERRENW